MEPFMELSRRRAAPRGGANAVNEVWMCVPCLQARPNRSRPYGARRRRRREGTERVRVSGRDATLVVWSPDYDGKGKAWVRFDDGTDAIVGGSRVER
jgi:hypothetical protein